MHFPLFSEYWRRCTKARILMWYPPWRIFTDWLIIHEMHGFLHCYLHDCHMLDTLLWRRRIFSIISKAVSVSTAFLLIMCIFGNSIKTKYEKWCFSLTFVPFDMHINVFFSLSLPTCLPVRICMDISHKCILRTIFSLHKVCVDFILRILHMYHCTAPHT